MSGRRESVELTNMCMIYQDDLVLVQDRQGKSWPGITFPGGHVEKGESIVLSTIREIKEETGLSVSGLRLCGLKQWIEPDYRYLVFLYKTDCFSGTLKSSPEGRVFWIKKSKLPKSKVASGFLDMLPLFFDDEFSEISYEGESAEIH